MQPDRISLFPLNVVLLPGEHLPLHIFEPRYRRMVRECLESSRPFGMLLALQDGIVRVGSTAEIELVTKRYDDGRMDILTIGRQPFRVVKLFDDDPLLEGDVEYLEDADAAVDAPTQERLIGLYETCHTLVFSGMPPRLDLTLSGSFSYSIAAALPIDLTWKQTLLELRSEAQRQERLVRYLREWALHLQKVGALRARGAGNGHSVN
jgi:ATP-dependent Lon protease